MFDALCNSALTGVAKVYLQNSVCACRTWPLVYGVWSTPMWTHYPSSWRSTLQATCY